MRTIKFNPAQFTAPEHVQWWTDFEKDAQDATLKAVTAWEKWLEGWLTQPRPNDLPAKFKHAFEQKTWSSLKQWLVENVFHHKCAYCESTLDLDRYLGDVEHYRPKGQVASKENEGTRVRVRVKLDSGQEIDHPGYFWLAYNWRNLMPACSACNSGAAKVDQFPSQSSCLMVRLTAAELAALSDPPLPSVKFPGLYYLGPNDLDTREQPVVLNPLNPTEQRAPRKHLSFGLAGKVVPKDGSEAGKQSIDVFNLKRSVLERRRQEAQEAIHRIYYGTLQEPGADFDVRLQEKLKLFRSGEKRYSAAALDYLNIVIELQRQATASLLDGDD